MLASAMSWGQIYRHDFGTTSITTHPYIIAPTLFDPNLSAFSLTNSNSAWTSFAGSSGQAIALSNSSGTPTITLIFNVGAGFQLSVTQFNFWRERSTTGAQNWSMSINGTSVGIGTVSTTGASIGATNVSNSITNLTGTITVVLSLSGATGTGTFRIDDFTLEGNVTPICTPPTIASVFPTSGSEGTEVIINASSGNLIGATATFGGVAAIPVSSSATQLVVKVPSGASSGNIVITDSQPCTASTPFTVIDRDISSCEGVTPTPSDLIIYEIHDEKTGSGGTITLFNGTTTTKNLTNYRLYRTTNQNNGAEINYASLSGTIAGGALGIITVTGTSCTPPSTNGTITGGFNENDGIQLRDAAGAVVIDDVDAYVPAPGYYMKRNAGAFIPRTSYVASDWTTITLGSGVCAPGLGTTPTITGSGSAPSISVPPTLTLTCTSTSTSISVTGVEGFTGGNPITYQWFEVAPNTTTWTLLTDIGVYTGSATNILNISSIVGLNGYQYYCQVRENTATCYIASVTVKINTGTTTWNGATWDNGSPTISMAAVINGNYNTTANGNLGACSLVINALYSLVITSNNYIEIESDITNNGVLDILNNGSLIQISNTVTNSGNISMSRIAKIRLLDYVYWSSPVASFPLASVSAATPANYFWRWNANVGNPNGGQGNWQAASGNMIIGRGYAIRGPNAWNASTPTDYTATFTGIPNNGVYMPTVNRGNITALSTTGTNSIVFNNFADNWNLVGNPYPSAIDAKAFLSLSPQNDIIEGSVRIWSHGNLPNTINPNPFYNSFVSNYATSDYITYNETGASTQNGFNGKIAAGQSFFVVMNDGPGLIGSVTFNNAMRSKLYDNSQFYKNTTENKNTAGNPEKNRIWLDIVAQNGEVARTLVGYIDGATTAKDRMYDAYSSYKPELNIFSLIGDEIMTIQGKGLPFENTDTVAIGIKVPINATYTIAINAVDGLFANNAQSIYLEDKMLNTIHNLSISPYTFDGIQGINNNRFVLRYNDATLSNTNFDSLNNSVSVISSNNSIRINSELENIKSYGVYDVLGRTLVLKNNLNTKQSEINSLLKNNQALIVKVTLQNNQVITKKMIF